MFKSKNAKPISRKTKLKSKKVKPMDTTLPSIQRYVEPILPERTSHKFNNKDIFEEYKKKKKQ